MAHRATASVVFISLLEAIQVRDTSEWVQLSSGLSGSDLTVLGSLILENEHMHIGFVSGFIMGLFGIESKILGFWVLCSVAVFMFSILTIKQLALKLYAPVLYYHPANYLFVR